MNTRARTTLLPALLALALIAPPASAWFGVQTYATVEAVAGAARTVVRGRVVPPGAPGSSAPNAATFTVVYGSR